MKKNIVFATLMLSLLNFYAQEESTINIKITEVPYQPVTAFLRVSFDVGFQQRVTWKNVNYKARNQIGFALGLISCKESDIQFETRVGFRQVDISNIDSVPFRKYFDFDILIGGRFFPRYPTFGLSRTTPVRLTFSTLGGLSLTGNDLTNIGFSTIFTGGFIISQKDNPSGILLELQYRLLGNDPATDLHLHSAWLLSVAWLFGP
ncbi:MAG: hypothetical protein N2Z72_06925 [Bacteroidales bacterium]|nr:hypothetical protein [Bacteroidales bacterium]